MKRLGKIVVCLASVLALNAGTRADDGVLPNNPYAPIVVRNVFSLNPAPTNDVNATPVEPPPKITLNGIMSIFGRLQALYKVAVPAKPGQPAKDDSYILSEGQRQDEIEVVQIDEKNSLVTFNNHGIVQELPLIKANAPAGGTPTPASGRPGPPPRLAAPNGENGGKIPGRFGAHSPAGPSAARNRGPANGGDNSNNGMGNGSALTPVPTGAGYSGQQQPQNTLTAEEQVLLIEANRVLTQDQVTQGKLPPLPPTPLTPADATTHGGAPLVPPPLP
jgi:hypothetical protein